MTYQKLELFYSYTFYDLIFSIILLIISLSIAALLTRALKINNSISISMYIIHHVYFLIYCYYSINYGSDALSYFLEHEGYKYLDYEQGRISLFKFIHLLSSFNIDYFNINYLFSIFSLIGFYFLLYIFKLTYSKQQNYNKFVLLFLFLPSIHFWVMGYSKDTLTFFCISIIFYQIIQKEKNFLIIFFAIALVSYVRLHIGLILSVSIIISYILNSKSYKNIFLLTLFCLLIIFLILQKILNQTPTLENIINFLNMFNNLYISDENTAINSDNFIIKMYYYLFAPNVFDIRGNNIFFLIIIIENTYLVLLSLYLIFKKKFHFISSKKNIFFLIFGLICLILFTQVTSNLGIASRQKWIFMPSIIIFLLCIREKNLKIFR
jgi:hypothetical protein